MSEGFLKTTTPERVKAEVTWYMAYPQFSPQVLEYDIDRGTLLLQELRPGTQLKTLVLEGRDEEATELLAQMIGQFPSVRDAGSDLKHVRDLARDLRVLNSPEMKALAARAQSLIDELCADEGADVVLHGDLHHENLILHGTKWMVIDPHAYRGPRAFEVGTLMRNPMDVFPKTQSVQKTIQRRLEILTETLPFSREEMVHWSFVCTLLSAAWNLMDGVSIEPEQMEILSILG